MLVSAYLEDILVYKQMIKKHLLRLKIVLSNLEVEKLYAKLSESSFNVDEVEFFEHLILSKGFFLTNKKLNP